MTAHQKIRRLVVAVITSSNLPTLCIYVTCPHSVYMFTAIILEPLHLVITKTGSCLKEARRQKRLDESNREGENE